MEFPEYDIMKQENKQTDGQIIYSQRAWSTNYVWLTGPLRVERYIEITTTASDFSDLTIVSLNFLSPNL